MKLQVLIASSAAVAYASPQYATVDPHVWIPGGPNDFRGPCPMMNTLANHGFLPRDGRNITRDNAIAALKNGINFNGTLGGIMWDQAIIANPEPNATFFTLDQLNVHGVLEHDASMTRTDAYLGNNHVFNETIYRGSKQWWTSQTVTAKQLAHSKIFRQVQSRATNPNYTFTASIEEFSLGEVAAPIIVFGDMKAGTVDRSLMTFFFENERLPTQLGWSKKKDEVTLADILSVASIVRNATNLLTGSPASAPHSRRDLHAAIAAEYMESA